MLIVGAGIATVAAAAGLVTGADTVLKVCAGLAAMCLAATAGINFRWERQRAREERDHPANCMCTYWSLQYLQEAGAR